MAPKTPLPTKFAVAEKHTMSFLRCEDYTDQRGRQNIFGWRSKGDRQTAPLAGPYNVRVCGKRLQLTGEERLTLVRAKVERAKKHFHDLEAELDTFRDRYQTIQVGKRDTKTWEVGPPYKIQQVPIVSFNILTTTGDAIHNLRSALDHLAYQLVLVGTPGMEPSRQVEFPIAKDVATYEADKPRKVKGMRQEAIEAIDVLKPYHGGTEAFWKIHELDNIDKHRDLFKTGTDWLVEGDWVPGTGAYLLKTSDPHFAGIWMTEVEKEIYLRPSDSFGDPEILKRNALLPTVKELVYFVDELVRTTFRALLE